MAEPAAARKSKILVVDDEESILELLTMGLQYEGYETATATSGVAALDQFRTFGPDLVILDVMLPDRDGISVCQELRRKSDVPVLMLTALGELEDKVAGLDSGADDYLPKPFKFKELMARVRALLRRTGAGGAARVTFEDVVLDVATHRVSRAGRPVDLTLREYELLELLMRRPHQVFSREQILNQVWGFDQVLDTNVVEVHVSALRSKLGDVERRLIRTVRGVGYALGG